MRRSLIIGRPNVGKTMFCIHFAKYLGVRELRWLVERTDGSTEHKKMSIQNSLAYLTNDAVHHTRSLQSLNISVPRGKVDQQLLLTDTTGLLGGIHPDESVRTAMAQTLGAMLKSDLILHIVDAHLLGQEKSSMASTEDRAIWSELDDQLSAFGSTHKGYLIIANKIDLPGAKQGYKRLCQRLSRQRIVPMSALTGTGFREVKQHVWRMA